MKTVLFNIKQIIIEYILLKLLNKWLVLTRYDHKICKTTTCYFPPVVPRCAVIIINQYELFYATTVIFYSMPKTILFPEPAIPWEGNGGSGIIRDRHTKNCMLPVLRMGFSKPQESQIEGVSIRSGKGCCCRLERHDLYLAYWVWEVTYIPASSLRLIELFFSNACAVRATYSFLYVDHGLSQSLRFLPKGSQAQGTRLCPKHQLYHLVITLGNKFEAEIRAEQEENRRKAEDAKVRKQQFKEKQAAFNVS